MHYLEIFGAEVQLLFISHFRTGEVHLYLQRLPSHEHPSHCLYNSSSLNTGDKIN